MNNEEIQKAIIEQYTIIGEEVERDHCKFELNMVIANCRRKISELQNQCSHLDANNELKLVNGRCFYCGKIMG